MLTPKTMRTAFFQVSFLFLLLPGMLPGQTPVPRPAAADKVKDNFLTARYTPSQTGADDYVGRRMTINLEKRLLTLNLASILEPYVHRPGKQTWIGEHVGKFLHAGTYTWQYTGNGHLKEKLDSVAAVLISTQLPDGYLGTYLDKDRWTDWDVWSHKYNLIGLLTYYQATGNQAALTSCLRMGDLLVRTFGEGGKDIIKSGTHVGMAPSSVLEPMVMLYRYTGDKRYLGFCNYLVRSWEQPHGPRILTSLLEHGNVHKTANGKAYEMLSNLVGLLDLYRITGEEKYLKACINAWEDIKTKRHYVTGTSSWGEHFQDDYALRPDGEVHGNKYESAGEGCVTVTWLQMNWHLLRLTGEVKYADELERITYNSLLGAQSPQDGSVCYFIPLTGRKRYGEVSHGILPDVSCCASSIPRGVALIPQYVAGTIGSIQAVVWQYIPGNYTLRVKTPQGNLPVTLHLDTPYPKEGVATLTVYLLEKPKVPQRFALQLRVPEWCSQFQARAGGETFPGNAGQLLTLERVWQDGDQVQITLSLDLRVIPDANQNSNRVSIQRGPQVLAEDDQLDTVNQLPPSWQGEQFYPLKGKSNGREKLFRMVPFADAGQTGGHYQVLLEEISNLKYAAE
jgi:DUF1680 family protein